MRVLIFFLDNNNVADAAWGFVQNGHEIVRYPDILKTFYSEPEEIEQIFSKALQIIRNDKIDACFSWNYVQAVSDACETVGIPYLSWSYDSPEIDVFAPNIKNRCNYFFHFDKNFCQEIKEAGAEHCYYLPLAVNSLRLSNMEIRDEDVLKYKSDICFLGNFYDHTLYEDIEPHLDAAMKKEIEDLFCKQINNWDENLIAKAGNSSLMERMQKKIAMGAIADYFPEVKPKYVYGSLMLARRFAHLERRLIIEELATQLPVTVVTQSKARDIPNVRYFDEVDYFGTMPIVFYASKINLNMTLRSIETGAPLRIFDILGSAGFALTNPQEALYELFEPDKDLVIYHSIEEMKDKIRFYLTHERDRMQIVANGFRKVNTEHNYEVRIKQMLEKL